MPSVSVSGKERPVRIFAVINLAGVSKGPKNLSELRKLIGIPPLQIQDKYQGGSHE
jgi:hypothetical protein